MRKLRTDIIDVDLTLPEGRRWMSVTRKDKRAATELVREAKSVMPTAIGSLLSQVFHWIYLAAGGLYYGEIRWWAKQVGYTTGLLTAIQCSYELGHTLESMQHLIFGCTAAVVRSGRRVTHARTLDWPLHKIAPAMRIVRFHNGTRVFYAVTPIGFVGVLTGMLPGAYSVTINYAPPQGHTRLAFAPSFLLRSVLETCDTYEEAVYALCHTSLSTSVFYTVCGVDKGCVIERTAKTFVVRPMRNAAIVQANHFVSARNAKRNARIKIDKGEGTVYECSKQRYAALKNGSTELRRTLLRDPVCNSETQHAVIMEPRTGRLEVWVR